MYAVYVVQRRPQQVCAVQDGLCNQCCGYKMCRPCRAIDVAHRNAKQVKQMEGDGKHSNAVQNTAKQCRVIPPALWASVV
eukprot:8961325-Pyramimonas_sp.AAC.1